MGMGLWSGQVAGMPADLSGDLPAELHGAGPPSTLADALGNVDALAPEAKLAAPLRALAASDKVVARVPVLVESLKKLDLSAFGWAHQFSWPAGEQVALLEVRSDQLADLAALPSVYSIEGLKAGSGMQASTPDWQEPERQELTADEIVSLQARRAAAPDWADTAEQLAAEAASARGATAAGGANPDGLNATDSLDGWFDARYGHAGKEAWDLGYRGEGVTVAVLDNMVDFAHPDLQGTWAVHPDGNPYAGFPQAFDVSASAQRALDANRQPDVLSTRTGGSSMIELYQTSETAEQELGGEMATTACFQPMILQPLELLPGINILTPTLVDPFCEYRVPATSKGGTLRFGHHPDINLAQLGAKPDLGIQYELAGVLIVDEEDDGRYDTVYVDVDNDRDFTDEKPVTRDDPLSWRDMDGDAVADLSGGLLYFISDGALPFPASWTAGLDEVLPQGEFIGLMYGSGTHGTWCASNVVAQGRLGVPAERDLRFRDLPGSGEPAAINFGMAPGARFVSIGDIYSGGTAAAYRYAVYGTTLEREDDDLQVTSNSYGQPGLVEDGWDASSRIVDYYVRKVNPSVSFLFSSGNYGPGYGSHSAPSPSVSLGIGASTQMGSTGYDSITDTMQITYGDIIPFSSIGPAANGRPGNTVAADGAYASGGVPINPVWLGGQNGTYANTTWGGTSRSSPVAAGIMSLVYQAFEGREGRWPSWDEASAILMASARFNGYDVFTAGAGVLDAADAVRTAGGKHGVYAEPSSWRAGTYQGQAHGAFPNLMQPGESSTASFSLHNPSDHAIEVTVSAENLRRIGQETQELVTDLTAESPVSPVPDYLVPLNEESIPEGTELMVARAHYGMAELDPNGDEVVDNHFALGVLQHTDINGDGKLWDDKNGDGVVNHRALAPAYVTFAWGDQEREHGAIEGVISRGIPAEGLEAEIAWFGLACNAEDGTPPQPEQEVSEKIALIERGGCTFVDKLNNAVAQGAIAAIVFTDDRPSTVMGGDSNVDIIAVMIDREGGDELRTALLAGESAMAGMYKRTPLKGLDGSALIDYDVTEMQEYEYMRMANDGSPSSGSGKNSLQVSVHHPRERWSDGLYLSYWHPARGGPVTNTHMTTQLDFYAYRPWEDVELSETSLSIPAGGAVSFEATIKIPADAGAGSLAGAIFVDYARGEGDEPVPGPGGYELAQQRVVIPLNAEVAASYDWKGIATLGGDASRDADSTYDNGALRAQYPAGGASAYGDHRFFFVDATEPEEGTYWLLRSRWDDESGGSDMDTHLYGPSSDRYTDPSNPANAEEDWSDPDWYGPDGLVRLSGSPFNAHRFNTTTGTGEDWVAAPASRAGLHEVILHQVRSSGSSVDLPFETAVSSMQISPGRVSLYGDDCAPVTLVSQIDLPGFAARAAGLSSPEEYLHQPIAQEDPDDITTAAFRVGISLTMPAVSLEITLDGEDDDDLDLFLYRDANADGVFTATEQVALSTSPIGDEQISLTNQPAGAYQVWVHGWEVQGAESFFDLKIFALSGDSIGIEGAPGSVSAGTPVALEVCPDPAQLAGQEGPGQGIVFIGFGGLGDLIRLPVDWRRDRFIFDNFLPLTITGHDLRGEAMPAPLR
jgi:subtilisin family serine protease